MHLAEVMTEVKTRGDTIAAFKSTFDWPVGSVPSSGIPALIVDYPEDWDPHATYARGAEEIQGLQVIVVCGAASDRASRDLLSEFVSGPGPNDLVVALESDGATAFDVLTVVNIKFGRWRVGDIDHIAAIFECDIVGSGAR